MRARVIASHRFNSIRSAGTLFTKSDWALVPAGCEDEVRGNELLEIEQPYEMVVPPGPTGPAKLTKAPAKPAPAKATRPADGPQDVEP